MLSLTKLQYPEQKSYYKYKLNTILLAVQQIMNNNFFLNAKSLIAAK